MLLNNNEQYMALIYQVTSLSISANMHGMQQQLNSISLNWDIHPKKIKNYLVIKKVCNFVTPTW
jgi:hypothetical protein